jgi:hypothetical protein
MSIAGQIDHADRTRITGWAFDRTRPDQTVALELWIGPDLVLRLNATQFRADLLSAGLGDGTCAFSIAIPGGLLPSAAHTLRLVVAETGADLRGSPVTLPAVPASQGALLESLPARMHDIGTAGTAEERDAMLRAMLRETDTLIRARAASGDMPGGMDLEAFYGRWGAFLDDPTPPVPRQAPQPPGALQQRALLILPAWAAADHPLMHTLAATLRTLDYEPHAIASGSEALNGTAIPQELTTHGPPFTATVEELLHREMGLFDAVLFAGTETTLLYAALARRHLPKARLLFLALALASESSLARATAEGRPELIQLAQAQRLQEAMAVWSTDRVLAASEPIRAALLDSVPKAVIAVAADDAEAIARSLRAP